MLKKFRTQKGNIISLPLERKVAAKPTDEVGIALEEQKSLVLRLFYYLYKIVPPPTTMSSS